MRAPTWSSPIFEAMTEWCAADPLAKSADRSSMRSMCRVCHERDTGASAVDKDAGAL